MSRLDHGQLPFGGGVGFTPTSSGAPDVKWVRPEEPKYVLPLLEELQEERRERQNAFVVTLLCVACTLLAVFDLFLLAWGL